ncbi:hypothetical protein C0584_00535 [Candidatus Parcubacteria bacterium]|nr:MAG: hypothetical protein C0584_00535 [Candidatus Parcubacteria bacterium]
MNNEILGINTGEFGLITAMIIVLLIALGAFQLGYEALNINIKMAEEEAKGNEFNKGIYKLYMLTSLGANVIGMIFILTVMNFAWAFFHKDFLLSFKLVLPLTGFILGYLLTAKTYHFKKRKIKP